MYHQVGVNNSILEVYIYIYIYFSDYNKHFASSWKKFQFQKEALILMDLINWIVSSVDRDADLPQGITSDTSLIISAVVYTCVDRKRVFNRLSIFTYVSFGCTYTTFKHDKLRRLYISVFLLFFFFLLKQLYDVSW